MPSARYRHVPGRRVRVLGVAVVLVLALAGAALVIRHVRAVKHPDEGVSTIVATPSTAQEAGTGTPRPAAREARLAHDPRSAQPPADTACPPHDRRSHPPCRRRRRCRAAPTDAVALSRHRPGSWLRHATRHVTFRSDRPFTSVDLWKPSWSWPVYGATLERSNAPDRHRFTPPAPHRLEAPSPQSARVPTRHEQRHRLYQRRGRNAHRIPNAKRRLGLASPPARRHVRLTGPLAWPSLLASLAGQLRAFDADNGRLLWQRALGSSSETPPLIVDGLVIVGTWDGHVFAFNASTGRPRGASACTARSPPASPAPGRSLSSATTAESSTPSASAVDALSGDPGRWPALLDAVRRRRAHLRDKLHREGARRPFRRQWPSDLEAAPGRLGVPGRRNRRRSRRHRLLRWAAPRI